MASQTLHTRLDKLEAALKTLSEGSPIFHFLKDDENPEHVIDAMVKAGRITALERKRVNFFRWRTEEEHAAHLQEQETVMLGSNIPAAEGNDNV